MTTREMQAASSLARSASGAHPGRYCQPRTTKPAPPWWERKPKAKPLPGGVRPKDTPEFDRLKAEAAAAQKRREADDYYSPKARQAPRRKP